MLLTNLVLILIPNFSKKTKFKKLCNFRNFSYFYLQLVTKHVFRCFNNTVISFLFFCISLTFFYSIINIYCWDNCHRLYRIYRKKSKSYWKFWWTKLNNAKRPILVKNFKKWILRYFSSLLSITLPNFKNYYI